MGNFVEENEIQTWEFDSNEISLISRTTYTKMKTKKNWSISLEAQFFVSRSALLLKPDELNSAFFKNTKFHDLQDYLDAFNSIIVDTKTGIYRQSCVI